jgi:hypothetical protein
VSGERSFAEWCAEKSLAFWAALFASPILVSIETWYAYREEAACAAERESRSDVAQAIRDARNSEEVVKAAYVSPS